jgi:hypothetical protein
MDESNYVNGWLEIDMGGSNQLSSLCVLFPHFTLFCAGALVAVGRIEVTNRNNCCSERIVGASISLLAVGREIVWEAQFDEELSTYTFGMQSDSLKTSLTHPPTSSFLAAQSFLALFVRPAGEGIWS